MEYMIIGIMVALNIILVLWKLRHHRIFDGLLDSGALILVASVFTGGLGSLIIGTIGSLIVSLYLLIFPPSFFSFKPKPKRTDMKFNIKPTEILW